MFGPSEEVLLEVPAADLRVYRLTRLVISGNKEIGLTLSPLEWAERFKEGARSSLLFVVGLALVPSGLLYAKLWTNPMAGWVDRDLTHAAVAMLVAAGLAVGFPIGLFLRRRPHRFLAVFADTVIVNDRDLGQMVGIDIDRTRARLIIATKCARQTVALRTATDAETLAEALTHNIFPVVDLTRHGAPNKDHL